MASSYSFHIFIRFKCEFDVTVLILLLGLERHHRKFEVRKRKDLRRIHFAWHEKGVFRWGDGFVTSAAYSRYWAIFELEDNWSKFR